jgi:hypothetical protein
MHVDGFVYGFAGRHEADAEFFCIELATGKTRWKNLTALGRGQILRVGDRLLLWGERGHLAAVEVNSEKLVPLARTELDPEKGLLSYPAWTPPAISRGRIYLRNEKALRCLDLKPKT